MVQPLEHHLCFSCDNLSVPQKQLANDFLVQGVDRLTTQGSCLPAWWGRSPLGVPFGRAKGTKTRLGRSPLRTSLGYEAGPASKLSSARHPCCGPCLCHHTRLPWAAGPITRWFPSPGLPWRSGVPAAESQAPDRWEQRHTRVRPWRQKYHLQRSRHNPQNVYAIYVT